MYSIDDILNDDIDRVEEDNVIFEDNENEVDEQNADDESEEVNKDVKDDDQTTKKTRKQGKRFVLNAETLKGPRGLVCMEKTFSKLKFKGHGHEQQDLDTVMNALQHWCHRLYPKFTFDDTLEQLERLGTKKTVVVQRKKIILNMIEEEVILNPDDDDDDDPIRQIDSPPKVDQFDLLLNEDRPPLQKRNPSPEIQLSDEQLEIMERNRLLAAERRRARLAQEIKDKENVEDNIVDDSNTTKEHLQEDTADNSNTEMTIEEIEAMVE